MSLVVVGSINMDIYVEVERLPFPGETISGSGGDCIPGGKVKSAIAFSLQLFFGGGALDFF